MKKFMIISVLALTAALSACGNNSAVNNNETDFEAVKDIVVGDDKTIETYEVSDASVVEKIKKINTLAVVEESINPGLKMLKVELPINEEPDDKAEEFFEDVEDIIQKCKLQDTTDYDFFYFSTSANGAVEITAAFKRVDGKLVLESVNGIGELYKNAPEIAAKESELFR